jgi:hypothetical protein
MIHCVTVIRQVALLFSAAAAAGPFIGLSPSLQMSFGFQDAESCVSSEYSCKLIIDLRGFMCKNLDRILGRCMVQLRKRTTSLKRLTRFDVC